MKPRLTALAALLALTLFACPKPVITPPTPPKAPPPPPVRVPEGCLESLAGSYRHSQNASFQYEGFDDGGSLELLVERPRVDGGFEAEDGGAVILLNRTPNGFSGATYAEVFTSRGSRCRVAFPTDLTACFDGGIVLRAAVSASVDDACQTPKKVAPAPKLEHVLLRGSMEPDAGAAISGNPLKAPRAPSSDGGVAVSSNPTMPASDAGNPNPRATRPDGGTEPDGGL